MNRIATLVLLLLVLSSILNTQVHAQPQLSVDRFIQVYPGFIVVNDTIHISSSISDLTIYMNNDEFISLYSIRTIPEYPIQWGAIKGTYMGFTILLNGFQGNLTLIRTYSDKIFKDTSDGVEVNIFAYLPSDYPIAKLNASVKFVAPASNINPKSPNGAVQKYISGVNYIVYNTTNLNSMNTTLLSFSFTPSREVPWLKINALNRTILIDNFSKVRIIDTYLLEYVGRAQTVTTWIPYLLPNASFIEAKDDFGSLVYTNGAISLRYPLFSTTYQNAFLNNTKAKIIITSEINIDRIGNVDQNSQRINLNLDALKNNLYIIDNLTIIISVRYPLNVSISPTPDQVITLKDGYDYIYYKRNIDPTYSYKISLSATINPYIVSLNLANQILAIVLLVMLLTFAYTRFLFRPKPEIKKIPEIPRFINLIETLIIDNEEIERLDEELEKGTIKKQEYTTRVNNLRRDIEAKESDFRTLSSIIISKYPETKQIISELNDAYYKLVKSRNALKEAKNALKMKRMSQEMYKRTIELNMRLARDSRTKIDTLINQLKERYFLK